MEWYTFEDKVPPFDTSIMVIVKSQPLGNGKEGKEHDIYMTMAKFSLVFGLKIDRSSGISSQYLMWGYPPELPVIL